MFARFRRPAVRADHESSTSPGNVSRLEEIAKDAALAMTALDPRVRKRQRRQRAACSAEKHRRVRLLEVGNQLHEQGMAWKEVADILQVVPRTLRNWQHTTMKSWTGICAESSSFGKRRACAHSRENLLATSNELHTMQAQSDASIEDPASPRASPSKRRAWAVLTWLGRTITPLLSRRKAAEIR